jgi:hypothetical protein
VPAVQPIGDGDYQAIVLGEADPGTSFEDQELRVAEVRCSVEERTDVGQPLGEDRKRLSENDLVA